MTICPEKPTPQRTVASDRAHCAEEFSDVIEAFYALDKGPWRCAKDGRRLYSDDFTHDVHLAIFGDFGSDEARLRYAARLVWFLNGSYGQALHREQIE
jgi:hypothetical protein